MIGAGIVAGGFATGGVSTVVGAISGGYLFLNGVDNIMAGAQQVYTGE